MRLASTRLCLALVLILSLFLPASVAATPPADSAPPAAEAKLPADVEYVPGEVLVRFRASASPAAQNRLLKAERLQGAREIKRLGVRVLTLPEGQSVEEAVKRLSRLPEIEWAEPNIILHALTAPAADPGLANQWGPQKMDAPAAWEITTGDPGVVIAVVDTGVDYLHSELAPNLWSNPDEIAGNGIDDDGNGHVDDLHGWDFQNNDAQPLDDHFHGTHVAGIAAAAPSDNPLGLVGVCPNCRIMAVKVLDAQGSGSLDRVASGIVYAAESGARVINLSLGATQGSPTLENAVNTAWSLGSLVVAGAGNNGADLRFYPAAYANAMAIASTNQDDWRSCFSNYGEDFIAVAAPGEYIYSSTPRDASGNDTYGTYSGTSMATPHVSGLAGLLFSQNPSRSNSEVRQLIQSSAEDIGPAGLDAFFGYGRVNAARALGGATSPTTPPAGLFADALTATGPANARKLARDDSGLLHWVWVNGGQLRYATSSDGESWSDPLALAAGADPALESDGANLYLAYTDVAGGASRIMFSKKTNHWSNPVQALGGNFNAVRPSLYRDPGNGRLHLAAASNADATAVYYASSSDGGQSWSAAQTITVGADAEELSRLAAVYADGDQILLLARTAKPTFFGLMYAFRIYAFLSADGGQTWSARQELGSGSGGLDAEPGVCIAGVGGRVYIVYDQGSKAYFRSLLDWATFSEGYALGSGGQATITQLADGQAWALYEQDGGLWWRHYTGPGGGWDSAEAILSATSRNKSYYPNFKLGASGEVIEWVTTHCSGAPFLVTYHQKALADMPVSYPLALSASAYSVDEGAGTATISVLMSQATTRDVLVDYATADGTAIAGKDYTATDGTLTIPAGATSASFTVTIKNDTNDEPDQSVAITLSNISNALPGAPLSAVLTIIDNDAPPLISFSGTYLYVNEGAGLDTATVKLSAASDYPVSVEYYSTDAGTASPGIDYQATSGALAFAPGETTKTFNVTILDDRLPEADETIKLALRNPSGGALGASASAQMTIDDNDTLDFSVSTYNVKENVGAAALTVKLNAPSTVEVRVDYASSDGTAIAGRDYTPVAGTVVFIPGETSKTVSVPIADDLESESDENFKVALANPINAGLGSPNLATVNIDDNDTLKFSLSTYSVKESDGAATITVKMNAASDLEVRVDYATQDGTALVGEDYIAASGTLVFAPGETAKTFIVTIVSDLVAEPSESLKVALSNPVNAGLGTPNIANLNIGDNDTLKFSLSTYTVKENAGTATITVKLSAASDSEVRVDWATSDDSAAAGLDYVAASGTLVFLPGETSKTFTVAILDDTLAEASETVKLTLSNAINAGLGSPSVSNLNISDNDTLKFSISLYSVKEALGPATITVKLSAASDLEVRVDYATSDGTALAGSDYVAASGTLVFAPGVTSKTFAVTLINDAVKEANESVKLTLSNPVNGGLGSPSVATLTISNDD